MKESEKIHFRDLLEDVAAACKGRWDITTRVTDTYFRILRRFSLKEVSEGVDRLLMHHDEYKPTPAAIQEAIRAAKRSNSRIQLSDEAKEVIELARKQRLCQAPQKRYMTLCNMWLASGNDELDDDAISEMFAATSNLNNDEFAYFRGRAYAEHPNQWRYEWPSVEAASGFKSSMKFMPDAVRIKFVTLLTYMDFRGKRRLNLKFDETERIAAGVYAERDGE